MDERLEGSQDYFIFLVGGLSLLLFFLSKRAREIYLRYSWIDREKLEVVRRREREIESRRERAKRNAEAQTKQVVSLQRRAAEVTDQLLARHGHVETALSTAEISFDRRAFSPFWDQIAEATEGVYRLKTDLEQLTRLGDSYNAALAGRDHDFPEKLPLRVNLQSSRQLLSKLTHLVDAAQRDFEFAVIWEHHKTRNVLIAGFGTLERAINGMEARISQSLDELSNEFSRSFDSFQDQVKDLVLDDHRHRRPRGIGD